MSDARSEVGGVGEGLSFPGSGIPVDAAVCLPATFKDEPFRLVVELVHHARTYWLPPLTRDGRDYWAIDLYEMVETIDGMRRSPIDSLDNQRWEVLDGDELVIRGVYRVEAEALRDLRELCYAVGCLPRPLPELQATRRERPSALAA